MRFLLRADAGVQTGTGHVMRCFALAEELMARDHEVVLRGALGGVGWLRDQVAAAGLQHQESPGDELDVPGIDAEGWDAVVVDSYTIDTTLIGELDSSTPVLAIIDGDDRGIAASLYLDQNLGAEHQPRRPEVTRALLAGSRYSLVRRSVQGLRRDADRALPSSPSVLAFMGGSDPLGAMRSVASSLLALPEHVGLTLVTAQAWQADVAAITGARAGARILDPTSELPRLLAHADLVVSATGTSAWDICTIGIPAVFAAVVDNQQAGLRTIVESGVGLGIDASDDLAALDGVAGLVQLLIEDSALRHEQVRACLRDFDGRGAARVSDELERAAG